MRSEYKAESVGSIQAWFDPISECVDYGTDPVWWEMNGQKLTSAH